MTKCLKNNELIDISGQARLRSVRLRTAQAPQAASPPPPRETGPEKLTSCDAFLFPRLAAQSKGVLGDPCFGGLDNAICAVSLASAHISTAPYGASDTI